MTWQFADKPTGVQLCGCVAMTTLSCKNGAVTFRMIFCGYAGHVTI